MGQVNLNHYSRNGVKYGGRQGGDFSVFTDITEKQTEVSLVKVQLQF